MEAILILILVLSITSSVVYNWLETRRSMRLRRERKQARAMANKQRSRRIQNAAKYNYSVYTAECREYTVKRYLH